MKKYHFGCWYIAFEQEMNGCDPEFSQFCAKWNMWVSMGSDLQGQISFLFDGHGMYFLYFFNTKLNS